MSVKLTKTVYVSLQSFCGLFPTGIFYGWGALIRPINHSFYPDDPGTFVNNHGMFVGIIILFLSCALFIPLRHILESKWLTEYQIHLIGLIMTVCGLVTGGISVQYKQLWLLYLGFSIPTGMGGLCLYQRLVFNHQFWFKSIELQNIGAGVFGFSIGVWGVIFFLISVPLLANLEVWNILYLYAALTIPFVIFPLQTIPEVNGFPVDEKPASVVSVNEGEVELPPAHSKNAEYGSVPSGCDSSSTVAQLVTPPVPSTIEEEEEEEEEQALVDSSSVKAVEVLVSAGEDGTADTLAAADSGGTVVASEKKEEKDEDRENELRLHCQACLEAGIDVDAAGHFELTYADIARIPQAWWLVLFFLTILTPGWGIQLASYSMLANLFNVSTTFSAAVTAIYVTAYAFGRLFSGLLAEWIGVFRTFDIIIVVSTTMLASMPSCAQSLPHESQSSLGCYIFVIMLCVVGTMYGGSIALFYSIVFDIFGSRNYRAVFSFTIIGFGMSIIIGGLLSAYSFQASNASPDEQRRKASMWFYVIAAGIGMAIFVLRCLTPYDYVAAGKTKIALAHSRRHHNNNNQSNEGEQV